MPRSRDGIGRTTPLRRPGQPLPNNTPRKLIGQLAGFARDAQAKVIYLDFDFRNTLPDDGELHDELARSGQPLILIPSFFTSGRLPACEDQDDTPPPKPPTELATVFADLTELPKDQPPGSRRRSCPRSLWFIPSSRSALTGCPKACVRPIACALVPKGRWSGERRRWCVRSNWRLPTLPPANRGTRASKRLTSPNRASFRFAGQSGTTSPKNMPAKTKRRQRRKQAQRSNDQKLAYLRLEAGFTGQIPRRPGSTGRGIRRPERRDRRHRLDRAMVGRYVGYAARRSAGRAGACQLRAEPSVRRRRSLDLGANASGRRLIAVAAVATVYLCWRPTFRALARGAPLSLRHAASTLDFGSGRVCGMRTSFRGHSRPFCSPTAPASLPAGVLEFSA